MAFRIDRRKLIDEVRRSSGFRTVVRGLEAKTVRAGRQLAAERTQQRTGAYERGFSARFTPLSSATVLGRLALENDAPHSEVIEKGSRPHKIRVRKARVLANVDTGDIFGLEVNHPGTQPKNVIRDALLRVASGRAQ